MLQDVAARRPPPGIPASAIDPFSLDFLRNPHPAHEALREAGPIVWLEKYGAYAAARHAEVRQILNDPATFCSSRGVGLSDFQREKPWRPPSLVLERDPPEHDRARAVLNRALSATVMRSLRGALRGGRGRAREDAGAKRPLRRDRRLRRSLSDDGHARCSRPLERRPRASVALCGDGVQHVRPRQRATPGGGRADGAARRVDHGAVQARGAGGQRHRSDDPCRRRRERSDAAGSGALGPVAAQRRLRHDRSWSRRGDAVSGRATPINSPPCAPIHQRRAPRSRRR